LVEKCAGGYKVDRGQLTQEGRARLRRAAVCVRSRAVDLKQRAKIPRVIKIYSRQSLTAADWLVRRDSAIVVWIAEVS
jgi:hypothetical protein